VQKLLSKYALAAHLALVAVAPLILLPFAGEAWTARVLLWLTCLSCIWLVMEPSRRKGEMPHDARARVGKAVISDPLFWFSLVLVVLTGIRAVNGGILLSYDAELMSWSVTSPAVPYLPGCVEGKGFLPFSVTVALAVIFQAARHGLGRSARVAFLLVSSVASAVAAIVLAYAISYNHLGVLALASASVFSASFFGAAFGITLLVALAAHFSVIGVQWIRVEPLAAFGLVGNAVGAVIFLPPHALVVVAVAFVAFAVLSFVLSKKVFEGSGSFRCSLAILIAMAAPVLYVFATEDRADMAIKIQAFETMAIFPDGFGSARDALSAISLKIWKDNPWIGTGLGSFPLSLRFSAGASDWAAIAPSQQVALNGWWQLLAERGVIGALLLAVTLGLLLWTYGSRCVASWNSLRLLPEHFVGPFALLTLVTLAFVECSYLRPEVLLLAGATLAFSGGAFPERAADRTGNKEG